MQNKKRKISMASVPQAMNKAQAGIIVFAYVTCRNKSEAKKIGKVLLQERLAACINIFDKMHSMYWWNGKIEAANETVLIANTTRKTFPGLSLKVKSLHSHSIPCILQIPVSNGIPEYVDWLFNNVK
jgi:periplasmic divalent cation tolerance protein